MHLYCALELERVSGRRRVAECDAVAGSDLRRV